MWPYDYFYGLLSAVVEILGSSSACVLLDVVKMQMAKLIMNLEM